MSTLIIPKRFQLFQIDISTLRSYNKKTLEKKEAIDFISSLGTLPNQIYTRAIKKENGMLIFEEAFHADICIADTRKVRIPFRRDLAPLYMDTKNITEVAINECPIPEWAKMDEISAEIELSEQLAQYPEGQHPQELIHNKLQAV